MSSDITIPTEVLCDIFHLLCDAPIALHDLKNESHFHEFPWAVGQVCRHWRGAFLSYTHLWTSFALKPGTFNNPAYFVEMNRRATIYLERSGEQPLTIVVSMLCSDTKKFPKTVWGMLLSCLKRWKKADLVLGYGSALDELLRCRGYMSSLESLKMSIPDEDFIVLKHYNAFQVTPHLTELDLVCPEYAATWQFPWAQLTKLKLAAYCEEFNEDLDNNILWGVLFQLKNIEELTIITPFNYDRWYPPSLPIILLPCLRLLETTLAFAPIFSWFTAPLLEHLHIHGHIEVGIPQHIEPYEREIVSLIQRSSCHIRRLAFESYCSTEEMRVVMKALDSVEELSIDACPLIPIIQEITGLDDYIYLPKLQVLQVTRNVWSHVEKIVASFSQLLEARGMGLPLASQDIVPLEKLVLRLTIMEGKWPELLEAMRGWPSCAQVYINGSVLEKLTPSH
ncbi:hypothetical protein F5887DRAFT_31009 [Amanita rubescens]|nr:hypothetical protein F5887DRAFT_31009 [Amanita rubescens]